MIKDIKAVIFDMDGVLVDSEPFWRDAMMACFRSVGIPFTENDCRSTTGMRIDEVIAHWHAIQPWEGKTLKGLEQDIMDEMCRLIHVHGKEMAGVRDTLHFLEDQELRIGLASSSSSALINAVLEKLAIRPFFDAWTSAELLPFGKPHPQVFLDCAQLLAVKPEQCLVIEDSINGLVAARAARMKTMVVPEAIHATNTKFSIADVQLGNLTEFEAWWCSQIKR